MMLDLPPRGGLAPLMVNIDDCLADVAGQWQPVGAPALAAHHQLTGLPVDVIEGERGDLPEAKPEITIA